MRTVLTASPLYPAGCKKMSTNQAETPSFHVDIPRSHAPRGNTCPTAPRSFIPRTVGRNKPRAVTAHLEQKATKETMKS